MNVRPLSDKLQKKAIQELNEDSKKIQEALDHINEWLQKQPHLNVPKDDQLMLAFLRGSKWSFQKAKEKLDSFYSMRALIPQLFMDRDPLSLNIQKVLTAGIIFPLPKVDEYFGPVILIYNLKNVDPVETPLIVTIKLFFMSLDILMKENDDFVVSGLSVLGDQDECPVNYYLQFTPTVIKHYVECFQNVYPVRIKSYAILNTFTLFQTMYNSVFKPFVSTKLQKRVHILTTSEVKGFLGSFPRNILPEEYGGTNGSLIDAAAKWKEKVESYREWFLEDAKYVTNGELRSEKANVFENNIKVDGSFRKLDID